MTRRDDLMRAIDYVEAHLTDEIDYRAAAMQAYMSEHHFQRVFSLTCGRTLGDYIRCRRMTLAGAELAADRLRVIDAAVLFGYDSADSFSRAFARFHGVSPNAARKPGVQLRSLTRLSIQTAFQGGMQMDYRLEEFPGATLTGYRRRFTGVPHGEERARQEEALFTTTRGHQWMLRGAAGAADGQLMYYGVVDHVTDDGYDFAIACPLGSWEREHLFDPSVTGVDFMDHFGFEEIVIPPGAYAVFTTPKMRHPIEKGLELRQLVALEWLDASGYQLRSAPEMEAVHWYPDPQTGERFVEIWLPVEKR